MFKKVITYIFVLVIILVLYELAFSFLKTYHNVDYTIIKKDVKYEINEIYTKKKSDDYYSVVVKNADSFYMFSILNTFNKQKNIVKDVKQFDLEDNITCLVLDLIDDSNTLPICLKDSSLYSYHALAGKYNLSSLDKYIKKYSDPETENYDDINPMKINYGYIDDDDEYIAIYNLQDILYIHNNTVEMKSFSDNDIYKNTYGYMVGKYYVIPQVFNDVPEITKYLIYDVTTKREEVIHLSDTPINKKGFYINGVYDKELYIVDKSNKKQYRINPRELSLTEVGNTNTEGYVYLNGKLSRENLYKLSENEIIFTENTEEYSRFNADAVYPQSNYAYYLKNGSFYKVYNNHLEYPVHLFDANNPNCIKVVNNSIYYVDGDKLYKYNEYGLNQLITRAEFQYNSYNIFDVYVN